MRWYVQRPVWNWTGESQSFIVHVFPVLKGKNFSSSIWLNYIHQAYSKSAGSRVSSATFYTPASAFEMQFPSHWQLWSGRNICIRRWYALVANIIEESSYSTQISWWQMIIMHVRVSLECKLKGLQFSSINFATKEKWRLRLFVVVRQNRISSPGNRVRQNRFHCSCRWRWTCKSYRRSLTALWQRRILCYNFLRIVYHGQCCG